MAAEWAARTPDLARPAGLIVERHGRLDFANTPSNAAAGTTGARGVISM